MSLPANATTITRNTILQHGELSRKREVIAGGAVKPGMMVQQISTGKYTAHAVVGGVGVTTIALEKCYQGDLAAVPVDSAYADGDRMDVYDCEPGDLLLVRVKTGETLVKGGSMISDGAGSLEATTGTPAKTPFVAEEAVTTASSNPLLLARAT